jgi:hypothetical protein
MSKRRKISGTGDTVVTILTLGIVVGGGYWLYTQFGQGGGESKTIRDTTGAALATDLAKQVAAGNGPTLSASEAADISTEILQVAQDAGAGLSQTDQDTVVNEIAKVGNTADLLTVMQDFGFPTLGTTSNTTLCGWLGINCQAVSFANFVRGYLDSDHLASVNKLMDQYNISYRF